MPKPSHKPYKYKLEKLRDAVPAQPAKLVEAGADLQTEGQFVIHIDTGIDAPTADLSPVTDNGIDMPSASGQARPFAPPTERYAPPPAPIDTRMWWEKQNYNTLEAAIEDGAVDPDNPMPSPHALRRQMDAMQARRYSGHTTEAMLEWERKANQFNAFSGDAYDPIDWNF